VIGAGSPIGALRALAPSVRPRPDSRGPRPRPRRSSGGGRRTLTKRGRQDFHKFVWVLVFRSGLDSLRPMDPNTHSNPPAGSRSGFDRVAGRCTGWHVGWGVGSAGGRRRGAAGADQDQPAPPPPAGCEVGYAWAPGLPTAPSGPPGPVPRAPGRNRPGPGQWRALGCPCRGGRRRHPPPARPRGSRRRTSRARGRPPLGSAPAAPAGRPLGPGRRPRGADRQAERRHARRGLWLSPTWDSMVATLVGCGRSCW
jgi:hypothetical protein